MSFDESFAGAEGLRLETNNKHKQKSLFGIVICSSVNWYFVIVLIEFFTCI
jgi:hypothetical protein